MASEEVRIVADRAAAPLWWATAGTSWDYEASLIGPLMDRHSSAEEVRLPREDAERVLRWAERRPGWKADLGGHPPLRIEPIDA